MPDNWSFVFAAYGLAALVLGGYWRRLARRERELATRERGSGGARRAPARRGESGTADPATMTRPS